jgi:hypothetical protein
MNGRDEFFRASLNTRRRSSGDISNLAANRDATADDDDDVDVDDVAVDKPVGVAGADLHAALVVVVET